MVDASRGVHEGGRFMIGKIAMRISSLAFAATALFALSNAASAATCDRACLLEQARQFNANMLAHTTEKIPLAANANIREKPKPSRLAIASGLE
jgi:DNA gyrase inhibitor GyrI